MKDLSVNPGTLAVLRRDGRCIIRFKCNCEKAGCESCEKMNLSDEKNLLLINRKNPADKLIVDVENFSTTKEQINIEVTIATGIA